MTRTQHSYILYVYVKRLDKYCKIIEFNTLEKTKKFLTNAKANLKQAWYLQSGYYKNRVPHGADLDNYYIRHIESKIETTILKDEVLEDGNMD